MQMLFAALCVLSFAVAGLEAAPQRLDWVELVEARKTYQPKDIWSNCTKPDDEATINNVTISPNPPVKGQGLTAKISVTFKELVTGGQVRLTVTFGAIPLYSAVLEVCNVLEALGLKCPISGTHTLSATENMPSSLPSGLYTIHTVMTDQNGKEVGCIDLDLNFQS